MSRNIIAIPPYYKGTSFEDIVDSLNIAKDKISCDIEFCGFAGKPLENTIMSEGALDDSRFIDGQWKLIKHIIKKKSFFEKILFLDFFNPGIDLLRYALEQDREKIKIGSLIHGGSFVEDDFYNYNWLRNFEVGWFDVNNVLYVPSYYLKKYCPENFKRKVKVKSWGLDNFKPKKSSEKKWDVIFPHRLQRDKGVDKLIDIIQICKDVEFLITTPQKQKFIAENSYYKKLCKIKNVKFLYEVNKENFADNLSQSRIVLSCASQESFGYSIMKAVACGCIPVFPNQACYPEFFDKKYLYKTTEEAKALIGKALNEKYNFQVKKEITRFSFVPLLKDFFE